MPTAVRRLLLLIEKNGSLRRQSQHSIRHVRAPPLETCSDSWLPLPCKGGYEILEDYETDLKGLSGRLCFRFDALEQSEQAGATHHRPCVGTSKGPCSPYNRIPRLCQNVPSPKSHSPFLSYEPLLKRMSKPALMILDLFIDSPTQQGFDPQKELHSSLDPWPPYAILPLTFGATVYTHAPPQSRLMPKSNFRAGEHVPN
jgi:hypothetical protein